jgi:hypothetical protein
VSCRVATWLLLVVLERCRGSGQGAWGDVGRDLGSWRPAFNQHRVLGGDRCAGAGRELCFKGHRFNAGIGCLRCHWRRARSHGRNIPGPLSGKDDQEALRRQTVDGDGVVVDWECEDGVTRSLNGAKQRTPEQGASLKACIRPSVTCPTGASEVERDSGSTARRRVGSGTTG